MSKWIKKYFEIERVIFFSIPFVFVIALLLGSDFGIYFPFLVFLLIIIFSICPSCKTSIIFYSNFSKFPLLRSIIFNEPALKCPKCGFPKEKSGNYELKNEFYQVDLFVFWRSIILFILFISIASLTLFYMLGPMFLDIVALSFAWGAVGIIVGNIWHACKFGFSRKILLVSTCFLIAFIFINLIFLPNAIGFRNALNNVKALNNDGIIEIRVDNNGIKTIIPKSDIEKFTKIVRKAEIFYISHETPIKEFELSIIKKDGRICCPAVVLKSHPSDIVISVRPHLFWNDIIIPQGAVWLRKSEQGDSQKDQGDGAQKIK